MGGPAAARDSDSDCSAARPSLGSHAGAALTALITRTRPNRTFRPRHFLRGENSEKNSANILLFSSINM